MPKVIATILAATIALPAADARMWVDDTGKNKIEAEFVSLVDGKLKIKDPSGRIIILPLEKLSAADQAFAKSQAGTSGVMTTTATAEVREWSDRDEIRVKVDLVGGLAATAYSIGSLKADPLTIGDQQFEPKKPFSDSSRFEVIERGRKGFSIEHPKDGVQVEIEYEVPKGTGNVGKVTGAVKVLAGGEAKEVVIKDILTRPDGAIKDPVLADRRLAVDFKRKTLREDTLQFEVAIPYDAEGFVRLELVGADGKPIDKVGNASNLLGKTMTYMVTAREELLKSPTLKLHFRDGGKEIDLPFAVKNVKLTR